MSQRGVESLENVRRFSPGSKEGTPDDGDQLDRSGHAIVSLLQQAADVAKENCDRAMDVAHKLSNQLRAAEDRVKQLEVELKHFEDRTVRAEKWLYRIYKEIEDRFFDSKTPARSPQSTRQ
jgi:hypothetical protein